MLASTSTKCASNFSSLANDIVGAKLSWLILAECPAGTPGTIRDFPNSTLKSLSFPEIALSLLALLFSSPRHALLINSKVRVG